MRVSTSELLCRSVIFESAEGNTGKVYISDSETNATTLNRHVLFTEGDTFYVSGSEYGALDALLNLQEFWIHGTVVGDRIVVSYANLTEDIA